MCCCLSKVWLKLLTAFSCIIVSAIGSVLIWGGNELLTFAPLESLGYAYTGYIVIGIGSALIFFSILGAVGIFIESHLLLTFYMTPSFIFGLILITIAVILIYARSLSSSYLENQATCISHFQTADDACIKAGEAICHIYCPCKASSAYIDSLRIKYFNSGITQQIFAYSKAGASNILACDPCYEIQQYATGSAGAIDQATYTALTTWIQQNLQIAVSTADCNITASLYQNQYFDPSMLKYFPLLTWVEEEFQCSGLCTPQEIFMFSDANNGKPGGSCQQQLNDWIQTNLLIAGIAGIVIGAYLVFNIFVTCGLCCWKKKEGNEVIETEFENINEKIA